MPSNPASRWDWERVLRDPRTPIKGGEQHALMVMATWANERRGWRMWPSVRTLAEATGLSEATIKRARRRAVALGFLIRTGELEGPSGRRTAVYRLALPRGDTPAEVDTEQPAILDPMGLRICHLAGVPAKRAASGDLSQAEKVALVNAKAELAGYPSLTPRERNLRDAHTGAVVP